MGRIMDGLGLCEILEYSGHHLEFRSHDEADSVITFNRPKGGLMQLVRWVISSINHGDFDRYKDGCILAGDNPSTFEDLKEIDDQEGWLNDAIKSAKRHGYSGAITRRTSSAAGLRLRLYEGSDYLKSWVDFYLHGAARSSPPRISIYRQSKEFGKRRVRGILTPLLRRERLNEVVEEMMSIEILKLESLAEGRYSTHPNRANYVIRTRDELKSVWAYLKEDFAHYSLDGISPLPKVDFRTHMVVAVFQGNKPTGQCGIGIGGVAEFEDRVEVHTAKTDPGNRMGSEGQSPYDIVKVPKRSKKELVFVEG